MTVNAAGTVAHQLDPIAQPDCLLPMLTPPPAPIYPPIPPPGSPRRLDAYVQAELDGETIAVAQAVPGARAHTLFRAAARLGELVGAGVLDETLAA